MVSPHFATPPLMVPNWPCWDEAKAVGAQGPLEMIGKGEGG